MTSRAGSTSDKPDRAEQPGSSAAANSPPSGSRSSVVVSFLLWQGAWLAVVIGAGRGAPLLGAGIALALILLALELRSALVLRSIGRGELRFVTVAALVGLAVDSALRVLGLVEFPPHAQLGKGLLGTSVANTLAPLWMALLWANLAAHCGPGSAFGWIAGRPRLAAVIGATSGPLAYFGGEKLGAITLTPPLTVPVLALAIVWGAAFPGLFLLRSAVSTPTKKTPAKKTPTKEKQ